MDEQTDNQGAQRAAEMLVHVGRIARCEAQAPSLTAAQWSALRFFAHANRISRTPSAFARFHATTRGTASQTVKSLEMAGYLARQRADEDGRSVVFDLTASGWAQLAADPINRLSAAIEGLPEGQREALSSALQNLAGALSEERDGQGFGSCGACAYLDTQTDSSCPYRCLCTGTTLSASDFGRLCANFSPQAPEQPTKPATADTKTS